MELTRKESSLLRALATRAGRKKSGCCRCEGLRAVRELFLYHPEKVRFAVTTVEMQAAVDWPAELIRIVPERDFEEFSATVNSQGVIAVAEIPDAPSGDIVARPPSHACTADFIYATYVLVEWIPFIPGEITSRLARLDISTK